MQESLLREPMRYVIDIPTSLVALLEELPPRSCAAVQGMLERIIERAELWPPGDPRWEQLAQVDEEGMHFYVDGCCIRVALFPEVRCLAVREIGRVLVHPPPDEAGLSLNP